MGVSLRSARLLYVKLLYLRDRCLRKDFGLTELVDLGRFEPGRLAVTGAAASARRSCLDLPREAGRQGIRGRPERVSRSHLPEWYARIGACTVE